MKRALYAAAVVSALALSVGSVTAEQTNKGSTYVESRGGLASTVSPTTTGGAAGFYVRDGVAVEAEGISYTKEPAPHRALASGLSADDETSASVGVTGMTHIDVLRTTKGRLSMGLGGGGVFSDKGETDGIRQGLVSQAGLGATVYLSDNVSLKAAGRYQRQAEFSDSRTESLGANIGLKINF